MDKKMLGIVGGVSAVFFAGAFLYFGNSGNTIDINALPGANNEARKEAQEIVRDIKTAHDKFELLRAPGESFADEVVGLEQMFAVEKYTDVISRGNLLKDEIAARIEIQKNKPKFAITFDAGAGIGATERLAEYLGASRVKITFFATGAWTEQNPAFFDRVLEPKAELKNELGNHTYSHPHFVSDNLSDEAIWEEIAKTEKIFAGHGKAAKPLFRYPYGQRSAHTDELLAGFGYRAIGWSVDSLGWQNKLTEDEIVERVVSRAKSGGILLMHVGSDTDVGAIPKIIERLTNAYQFVFVSEL